mmetsp:Transcript_14487/g.26666  ORF Transcript_14487/g.26666 Transcript_14487/m.26666 type:complete len:198 (-) Transcript_14487:165-758(-)
MLTAARYGALRCIPWRLDFRAASGAVPGDDAEQHGGLALRASPVHGLGVFAMRHFHADEVLEVCPCLKIDKATLPTTDAAQLKQGIGTYVDLRDYLFLMPALLKAGMLSSRTSETLLLPLGYGMAYNHGEDGDANASFGVSVGKQEMLSLVFKATRSIAAGEELLVDYGQDWWHDRGLQPVSSRSTAFLRRRMLRSP